VRVYVCMYVCTNSRNFIEFEKSDIRRDGVLFRINGMDCCIPPSGPSTEWVVPSPMPLHTFEEQPVIKYCTPLDIDDTNAEKDWELCKKRRAEEWKVLRKLIAKKQAEDKAKDDGKA